MTFRSVAIGILFISCSLADAAEPLPVEAFARLPDVGQVRLSPDGKKVAALAKVVKSGEMRGTAVQVYDVDKAESSVVAYGETGKFVIRRIIWANNDYVLVSARFPALRFGTPTTETRMFSVDINTKESRGVLSGAYLRRQEYLPQYQDRIIDLLPAEEDEILLAIRLERSLGLGVIKVDISNSKVKRVLRERSDFVGFATDRQHRIRVGVYQNDTEYQVLHHPIDDNSWIPLWTYEAFSADSVWPLGFAKDPNILFVRAYHEGREAVFKVDLRDPSLNKELVFSDPVYDASGSLIYSELSGRVVGIRYSADGGFTFWDDEYKALQEAIDRALPETTNILYSMSDDERRYVIVATSDTEPGTYYVGDRDKNSLKYLARRRPALPVDRMSAKNTVTYEARDGLEIEGFLTLPQGEGEGPYPAIVFPHGGPISFDDGGFDYWTQYFASRGYAVLQMNFRGSAGYGYDFMKAGLQNWGLEMQNDVEDGTRWLIEEGIADPDHICVVGASYGGYAALMEAVRNPDLYNCAVSFAGVTDVADLVSSQRRYSNYEIVKEQVGSKTRELRQRSPLHNVDDIEIPVLLAHGTKDRSVPDRHSRRMHRALEKDGKDVTYLEFEDGDHHLSRQEHRIAFFKAMDEFLQSHL